MKIYRLNPPVSYYLRGRKWDPPIPPIIFFNQGFRQLSYPLEFSPRLLNSLLLCDAQNFWQLINMIRQRENTKLIMFGRKSRQELNRIFQKQQIDLRDLQW